MHVLTCRGSSWCRSASAWGSSPSAGRGRRPGQPHLSILNIWPIRGQYYPELADDEVVGGEEGAGHQGEPGPRHLPTAAHLTNISSWILQFLTLIISKSRHSHNTHRWLAVTTTMTFKESIEDLLLNRCFNNLCLLAFYHKIKPWLIVEAFSISVWKEAIQKYRRKNWDTLSGAHIK